MTAVTTVETDTLRAWSDRIREVRGAALESLRLVSSGNVKAAQEKIVAEVDAPLATLRKRISDAGSFQPDTLPEVPLDKLNTAATRRFVAALEEALEAAREVDRERFPNADVDVTGVQLADLLSRWQVEVYGPAGRIAE